MKKAILIGAGEAGRIVLANQKEFDFEVHAWLDDDVAKHPAMKKSVHNIGAVGDLSKFIGGAEQIIVAIAGADVKFLERIKSMSGDKQLLVLPPVYQQLERMFSWEPLRPMNIEDILSRPTRKINLDKTREYLKGGTVLIAGAAGSIGSELSNLVCSFGCKRLVLVDIDENALEALRLRLEGSTGTVIEARLCDAKNIRHLERIFECRPKIVFNCAAHKHVPAGESNPSETVNNNLLTTKALLELCTMASVEKFLHISTDKAVTPTSIMGASKSLCESLIQSYEKKSPKRYIVRFGNVLNSRGSVLQVWEKQLKESLALTITDPKMERYLMSITEACQLVLKSIEYDPGTYILDMGERITVEEMLDAFLKIQNVRREDARIIVKGVREGEKFKEELLWPEEKGAKIGSEKIIRVTGTPMFDYKRVLKKSSDYDDVITAKTLASIFPSLEK